MARLILVRHCESESNRAGGLDGGKNSPLSGRGRAQTKAVRRAFEGLGLDWAVLISSPLARAADTAAVIGQVLNVTVDFDVSLSAGETVVGRKLDLDDPATLDIIGGEMLEALQARMAEGAETLVVVSHRYPIWALLTRLYGQRGTEIMGGLNDLGNGDRLEFVFLDGEAQGEPVHWPLSE